MSFDGLVSSGLRASPFTQLAPCSFLPQAKAHELNTIKMGSAGCWVVSLEHVLYNCFATKRLASLPTRHMAASSEGKAAVLHALHPITDQLFVLHPTAGRLGVVSFADGDLRYKCLHAGLPALQDSACRVRALGVHQDVGLLLSPQQLLVFHLRSGQLRSVVPLPEQGRLSHSFWVDRHGPTALGLWSHEDVVNLSMPPPPPPRPPRPFSSVSSVSSDSSEQAAAATPQSTQRGGLSEAGPSLGHRAAGAQPRCLATDGDDATPPSLPVPVRLPLPLSVRAAHAMGIVARTGGRTQQQERLGAEVRAALAEVSWLRGELHRIHQSPIIRSEKSTRRDVMTQVAEVVRRRYVISTSAEQVPRRPYYPVEERPVLSVPPLLPLSPGPAI